MVVAPTHLGEFLAINEHHVLVRVIMKLIHLGITVILLSAWYLAMRSPLILKVAGLFFDDIIDKSGGEVFIKHRGLIVL
jgi:hypothetical protein